VHGQCPGMTGSSQFFGRSSAHSGKQKASRTVGLLGAGYVPRSCDAPVHGRHISGKAELNARPAAARCACLASYRLLVSSATTPCRPVQNFIQVKRRLHIVRTNALASGALLPAPGALKGKGTGAPPQLHAETFQNLADPLSQSKRCKGFDTALPAQSAHTL
jgi:hypothetical protein